MSDDLVGEVRVKVRPDAHDFRKDTDRDVSNALKGVRGEVPIDGKLRIDRNQVQRQIDVAREKLRGGDVKIVAKIETQIDKSYEEWGKAADEVKRKYDQLKQQEKKWLGANDKLNDPLRKAINLAGQEAGRLRKIYEELEQSAELAQARDNQRIQDREEARDLAVEQEKARLRELNAAQLKAEREKRKNQQEYALLEEELERRRTKMRLRGSFDYQAMQAKNNAEIEMENRRHLKQMQRDFELQGMRSDASTWNAAELIAAKRAAAAGQLDALNEQRVNMEVTRRLQQQRLDRLFDPNRALQQAAAEASLHQYMQKVDNHRIEAQFQKIRDEAKKTSDHIDKLDPQLKVEPVGLLATAAQLSWASRPRTVPFYVTVNQKSLLIAEGMLKSLAGLNALQKGGQILEEMLVNFDKFSLKWGGVATVVAGLTNSFAWLGTATVGVVADTLKLTGALAMLPTVIAATAATVTIHTAAFDNMKKAIDGDNEALAALPKNAQLAVRELRGLWDQLQKPIQENFWESMGEEAAETLKILKPLFTEGLAGSASHVGAAWSEAAKAMRHVAERGHLKAMFDNLSAGFDNAADAAYPLTDAMNRLGYRGSQYLPQFGGWISDISHSFGEWIKQADEAGDINRWIVDSVHVMEDLGSSVKSVTRMFMALADVAEDAGAEGLIGMRDSLREIADVMESEPWRSDVAVLLAGARRGATELNTGFKSLSRTVGEGSVEFAHMLDLLGRIGGGVLDGVGTVIGRKDFKSGITTALEGMVTLIRDVEPGLKNLGDVFGTFGRLAGTVFQHLAEPVNAVLELMAKITGIMEGNLVRAVPVLSSLLTTMVNRLAGPVTLAFEALDALVGILADLGPAGQTALLTLGSMLALRGPLSAFFGMVGRTGAGAFAQLTNEVKRAPGALDHLRLAWREQLRLVERLNPATMGYATSIKHVGYGRATLGHIATAFTHINNGMSGYTNHAGGVVAAAGQVRDGFVNASRGIVDGQRAALAAGSQGVTALMRDTAGKIKAGFSDAGTSVKTSVGGMTTELGRLGTAAGRAAGAVGGASVTALRGAAVGLIGAMGGGWGLAIMAGAAAIMTLSQKSQEAAGRVNELRDSLDSASGAVTEGTYKTMATQWAQLDKEGQSAGKTARALGMDLGDVTRAVADGGQSYTNMIASLKKAEVGLMTYSTSMEASNSAGMKWTETGKDMERGLQELADGMNVPVERLRSMNSSDLKNLREQLERTRSEVSLAQAVWEGLAEATGSSIGNAKQMAAAMQVIGDNSVDAAGKIDAIKKSLDLLNGGVLSAQEAKIAAADAQQAAVDQAAAMRDQVQANRDILTDGQGMLNSETTVARGMYHLMRDSADALLVSAQSAYDAAIASGKTPADAAAAAREVMSGSEAALQGIADAAGVTVDELRVQWESFFGEDWELVATFSASAQRVQEAAAEAEKLGADWDANEFTAWLMANGGPANVTADQVTSYLHDKLGQQFIAQLQAAGEPATTELARVAQIVDNWTQGNYEAWLKSLDKTQPGLAEAVRQITAMTGGDYKAAVKALNSTADGISKAKFDLNSIPPPLVSIISKWAGIPPAPALPSLKAIIGLEYAKPGPVPGGGVLKAPQGENGFIWDGRSNPFAGKFAAQPAMIQAFANGGIVEKPGDAKIYSAASTYRVFAEASTGGESYIPLSASKRSRSLQIWHETGRLLGVDTTAYADGGISGAPRSTTGGVTVNIDQMVNQTNHTPEDFARSLFRKVRAAGALPPVEVI